MITVTKPDGREWVLCWLSKDLLNFQLEQCKTTDVDGINNVPYHMTLVVPEEKEMADEGWFKDTLKRGAPIQPGKLNTSHPMYKKEERLKMEALASVGPKTFDVEPVRERLEEEQKYIRALIDFNGISEANCLDFARATERALCLIEELLRVVK